MVDEPTPDQSPFLYDASVDKLERFFLLCAFSAGKSVEVQSRKLDDLLTFMAPRQRRPFLGLLDWWTADGCCALTDGVQAERVSHTSRIGQALRRAKTGQYTRLTWLLHRLALKTSIVDRWLQYVEREELLDLHGFGMRSASMFLLHTRRTARVASLDTHVLRWLSQQPGVHHVPPTTPSGSLYLELEHKFCALADDLRLTPAELDWIIWRENATPPQRFITQM